jgi:hypothetical protein
VARLAWVAGGGRRIGARAGLPGGAVLRARRILNFRVGFVALVIAVRCVGRRVGGRWLNPRAGNLRKIAPFPRGLSLVELGNWKIEPV